MQCLGDGRNPANFTLIMASLIDADNANGTLLAFAILVGHLSTKEDLIVVLLLRDVDDHSEFQALY